MGKITNAFSIAKYKYYNGLHNLDTWKPVVEGVREDIYEQSIFLKDDFRRKVLIPQAEEDQAFRNHYGRHAEDFGRFFFLASICNQLVKIPLKKIKNGPTKENELRKISARMEIDIQSAQDARRTDGHGVGFTMDFNGQEYPEDQFRKQYMEEALQKAQENVMIEAFRLTTMIDYLNISGYMRYENDALKKDRGQIIVNFWKNMKQLTDYSGPENDHDSGRRDDEKELILVRIPPQRQDYHR